MVYSCLAQQSTSAITECAPNEKEHRGPKCGKCKTIKLQTFTDSNGKHIKTRLSCEECNSGFPNGDYQDITSAQSTNDIQDFGDYCSKILPTWTWFAIIGVTLLGVGLAVFLLRGKLRCFAKKPGELDTSLNPNTSHQ